MTLIMAGQQLAIENSAERIRELHRLARLGTWEWDVRENRVSWSEEMYRIAGWEIGSPISFERYTTFLHPDDRERTLAVIQEAYEERRSYTIEHRAVRPDGTVCVIFGRGEVQVDESGAPVRMLGTAQDITERRELEEKRQQLLIAETARKAVEAAHARVRFLAHASLELASSLDYETTLRNVARLSVPQLADWCAIDLLGVDGKLSRLAVEHRDPAKVRFVQELTEKYPTDPQARHGAPSVIRTRSAEIFPDIPDALLEEVAKTGEHLELLRSLGLKSFVVVPLLARGSVLGALTLVHAESDRRFGEEDLPFVEELARRAAMAIDNSRIVRELSEARDQLEQQAIELELQATELETQAEELRQQTEALSASEHRYAQILDSVQDMIFTKAYGSKVTYANRAACEYYGMSQEELRGITDVPFNRLDFTQKYLQDDLAVFETKQPVEVVEEPNVSRTGELRYFHTVKTPIFDVHGEVVEIVGVSRDVTDQAIARRAIEEANRVKSEFLAVMSHELRTPLSAMIGYSDLLIEGVPEPLPERARENVRRIGLSARHLRELIDDILSFSRLEAGRETVQLETLAIQQLVDEVRAVAEPLAEAKGVTFTCESDEALTIRTDGRKLRQILLNLLGNAVKFTEKGSVHLSIRRQDADVLFTVEDTGIGITPEELQRVFEPFYQGEGKQGRGVTGAGLGLAICRRLAELLSADLTVASELGRDSSFSLRLRQQAVPA